MSVYSTPTRTCFDEGFSPCSNQSLYFTPGESFSHCTPPTRTKKRATPYRGKIPKFNVYDEEISQYQENIRRHDDVPSVSSPIPITGRDNKWRCQNAHSAKEAVVSLDKENIGVQFCSTPSLLLPRTPTYSPLRNISNQPNEKISGATVFEARISSVGKHFDVRIRTEADVDQLTKCSVVQNSPIFTPSNNTEELLKTPQKKENSFVTKRNGTLFRSFALGRKLRRKSTKSNSISVRESSTMVDTSIQSGSESKSEYFSEKVENTDVPRIQDEKLQIDNIISTPVKNSLDSSQTPLLIEKKTPPQRVTKFWQFIRIRRLKISPVKRLLTKPTRYLILFKEKISKHLSLHPIKTLLNPKSEEVSYSSVDNNSVQMQQICTQCLENLSTKEETTLKALSALMAKLTSVEEELKEIKGLVKNNANTSSQHRPALLPPLPPMAPPPPPPPPPPDFLNSIQSGGTLKRKADLTTPENVNHAVKRPAIKNEKTQFSITVEDIRSVKLRKTPAHVFKPRDTKESTVRSDEVIRSSRFKKDRQSVTNGKNRTQSLAELISSNGSVTNSLNSVLDSSTPLMKNLSTICLHEETPVTSKNTFANNRSQKRKEWLIESPVRKRANTGNNSNIYLQS